MPRLKPKRGPRGASSTWYSRSHTLSDKERLELAECIGLTPTTHTLSQVLDEVERLLGQYDGAVQAIDNAPRPSDYMRGYQQLDTQAHVLSETLRELSPRLREQLEAWLMDTPAGDLEHTEQALDALGHALTELLRIYAADDVGSTGRPRNIALQMIVQGLRDLFRKHYGGSRRSGQRRGAIKYANEMNKRERRFVTVALEAANIPTAGLEKLLI